MLELACKLQTGGVLRSSCACKSGESRPTTLCSHTCTLRLHRLVLHVRLAIGLVYPGARRTVFSPVLLLTTSGASAGVPAGVANNNDLGRSFFRKLLLSVALSDGPGACFRGHTCVHAMLLRYTRARANGLSSRVESRHLGLRS